MLLYIVFEAVEISGDVAWWLRFVGILVGVFVFSTISFELFIRSAIRVPLLSVVGECQSVWCALKSPVSIVLLCSVCASYSLLCFLASWNDRGL